MCRCYRIVGGVGVIGLYVCWCRVCVGVIRGVLMIVGSVVWKWRT